MHAKGLQTCIFYDTIISEIVIATAICISETKMLQR